MKQARSQRYAFLPGIVLGGMLLAWCPNAFALNPALDVSQYAHTSWRIREGFTKGLIQSIAQTTDGYLWLGTDFGLVRFDGVKNVPWEPPGDQHLQSRVITSLLGSSDGTFWIGTDKGLAGWNGTTLTLYPQTAGQFVFALLEDREGAVWAGTYSSDSSPTGKLCVIHNGSVECYGDDESLGPGVLSLYEDTRGNLWVSGEKGLWRWKPGPPEFLPMPGVSLGKGNLAEDVDGALLIVTDSGIKRLVGGKTETYPLPGPAREFRVSRLFRDRDGGLWIGTFDRGIVHVHQGRTDLYSKSEGLSGDNVSTLFEDREGTIWVATPNGLDRFREFAIPTLSVNQGLSNSSVWSVLSAKDGSVLLATAGGVNRWNNGQFTIHERGAAGTPQNSNAPNSLFQDSRGRIWAVTQREFGYLENGRFMPLSGIPGGVAPVQWLMEDNDHSFWLYTTCGLLRIAGADLNALAAAVDADKYAKRNIQAMAFDVSDGVTGRVYPIGFSPQVARSADGRLWFPALDGVSVVDPKHLPFNSLQPPVQIEFITADGNTLDAAFVANRPLRLPALTRDLRIEYTALSFVATEKVLFRYKLEDWDRDWQDAGTRREASYNNVPPGNYRFRVMACNNSGVWNEAGTFLDFSIAPAYYQTTLFRVSCAAAFLLLLAALYRLRLRQVARQFNMRLEERVGERTRIARELHDTLLQSFQGVLLKFSAVRFLLPPGADEAQKTLEKAIDQAEQAIADGRDAVQGLRSSTVPTNDLARVISALGEELAGNQSGQNPPAFSVDVEGVPQSLAPLLQDEVHRIAVETLRNAYRHAGARRIEVEIRYGKRQFRLRVRDNGKGFEENVVDAGGREGHFGLTGMRERAELVGGNLAIWSELDSGTEIELTIPASVAYAKPPTARQSIFLGRRA